MGKNLFIFMICAGVFTAMLPSRQPVNSVSTANSSSDRPSFESRRTQPADQASPDAIQLTRESNGHFYADVQINGMPVHVLVDTGASGIALSRGDAQRAGIVTSAAMFQVIGQGANGDVHGEEVRLDRVTLGPKTVEGMPAVVLDAGDQSLLGQSFLSEFDTVEIRGDTMFLR
jgi:aspartyl protease family protein